MTLFKKNVLKMLDFSAEEILELLNLATRLKKEKKEGVPHRLLEGKSIALIFEKPSTRTRCAFEVAAYDLGMHATYLGPSGTQIGSKESIADTARVLSRMYDGIEYRGFEQERVEALARYADVPVWNGLTNEAHPTQILADLLTIKEYFGELAGKKIVFLGDARNNMGNSLMVGCAKMGMHYVACAPEKYWPETTLVNTCKLLAEKSGGSVECCVDPSRAVKDAHIIYTDVWVSMGEPKEIWDERIADLENYKCDANLMKIAGNQCRFMHCLPAFHDLNTDIAKDIHALYGLEYMEVSDEVFEGPQSIVFDEAENRLHTIKAIMAATLCETLK